MALAIEVRRTAHVAAHMPVRGAPPPCHASPAISSPHSGGAHVHLVLDELSCQLAGCWVAADGAAAVVG